MITGEEKPDGGKLTVGPTVKVAHVDQNRDALNDKNTIFEEITGGTDYIMLGKQKVASRGVLRAVQLQGAGPAEARRQLLGRRAEPNSPREAVAQRRQFAVTG